MNAIAIQHILPINPANQHTGSVKSARADKDPAVRSTNADKDPAPASKAEANKAEANKVDANKADANKTEANKADSNKADANKAGANKAADGSEFGAIVNQMLAIATQNGLVSQAPSKPAAEAGIPVLQSQVQGSTQQSPDLSKLIQDLQDQKTEQTPDDAVSQFSEMLKTIKDGEKETPEQPLTQADAKDAEPAKQDLVGKNSVDPASKEKNDQDLFLQLASASDKSKDADTNEKAGSSSHLQSKTDFTSFMQQEQPVVHAAPSTVAEGTGRPVTPLHSTDPADMFDHAVSIVKDGNRIAVQMDHGGLGKLDINLSLNKGVVNAQFQVADDATKNLLENNMQQIIHSLLNEGLTVGGFSVALKQHQTWDGTNDNQKDNAGQSKAGYAAQAVSATRALDAGRGLVNIFI